MNNTYPRAGSDKYRLWEERFWSYESMLRNGASFSASIPTVLNGKLTSTGVGQRIRYLDTDRLGSNLPRYTMTARWRSSDVATNNYLFGLYDGVSQIPWLMHVNAGVLYAYVTSTTGGSLNVAANTDYHLTVVFDGSLVGNNRLKLYQNGLLSAFTAYIGVIPASTGPLSVSIPLVIMGTKAISTSVAGYEMKHLGIWAEAWDAPTVLARYQADLEGI